MADQLNNLQELLVSKKPKKKNRLTVVKVISAM